MNRDDLPMPRLDRYRSGSFERGRSALTEAAWLIFQSLILRSFIPGSLQRRLVLRLFGARIGKGVVLKPGIRVKFPWRLSVGDHTWIGEDVWIDNLANVSIGRHCCLSQGAYICTGSHNWSKPTFDLITKPVVIEDGAWIAAAAKVAPGITVGKCAVLGMGSVATENLVPRAIYFGLPAQKVRQREWGATAGSEP